MESSFALMKQLLDETIRWFVDKRKEHDVLEKEYEVMTQELEEVESQISAKMADQERQQEGVKALQEEKMELLRYLANETRTQDKIMADVRLDVLQFMATKMDAIKRSIEDNQQSLMTINEMQLSAQSFYSQLEDEIMVALDDKDDDKEDDGEVVEDEQGIVSGDDESEGEVGDDSDESEDDDESENVSEEEVEEEKLKADVEINHVHVDMVSEPEDYEDGQIRSPDTTDDESQGRDNRLKINQVTEPESKDCITFETPTKIRPSRANISEGSHLSELCNISVSEDIDSDDEFGNLKSLLV
ncbi:hypothetical protein HDE_06152 [Halotydeus destructor]|nr:hypothetical protein HDE_06152 [Halotydeus destructor]